MSGRRGVDATKFLGALDEARRISQLAPDQLSGYTVDELGAAAQHLRVLAHHARAAAARLDVTARERTQPRKES